MSFDIDDCLSMLVLILKALIVVPEENWINFVLNPSSDYSLSNDYRPLLDSELAKLYANPADEVARTNCGKICQLVVNRHPGYGRDNFMSLFRGCLAAGRKDLAEKAIRTNPFRDLSELLELVRQCQAVGHTDLAASAIKAYPCRNNQDLNAIISSCKVIGREDLAASVINAYPCRSIHDLNAIITCCKSIGQEDLAAPAIKACPCRSDQDFNAIILSCKSIGREDLLEPVILARPCRDKWSFPAIFMCCMDLKRVDLAAKVIEMYHDSAVKKLSGHGPPIIPADFRATVMPLVASHSADYTFQEWKPCLEPVFRGYDKIAELQRAMKALADKWTHRAAQDCSDFNMWRRTCWERVLQRTSALDRHEAFVVNQVISEEGNSFLVEW